MNETRQIIADSDTVCETDFLKNMDQYYTHIKKKLRDEDSVNILDFMRNLQFLSVFKTFKLIDEKNYERKDIFIELNETAEKIWENYLEIREVQDRIKQRLQFLKIKKAFYDYVISVPANFVSEKEYANTHFVYINKEMLSLCYDRKTGWIRKTEDVYTF